MIKAQHKDAKALSHKAKNPFESLRLRAFVLCTCLCILLIAFFLRFHNLGAQSFWNDEGSSYVQATRSFAEIASNAARDIHPPGYYGLLALWRQFSGDSEFGLRALSAFASVLTVAFTYALGKRLFNPVAGLLAALFVALNTFSIYYAQEARMYSLLALWGVMGMWALAGLLQNPYPHPFPRQQGKGVNSDRGGIFSPSLLAGRGLGGGVKWAFFLALINAAGLYTQYAYPFVMLAQGVTFLVWLLTRIKPGNWRLVTGIYFAANVLTILLYAPWIPTALHQLTTWPSTGQPIPAVSGLLYILMWFTFGMFKFSSPADFVMPSLNVVATLLVVFGGLRWHFSLSPNSGRGVRIALPLLWAFLPVGLFLILGLFREANLKLLLPSQIGFALCLGMGIAGWWIVAQQGYKWIGVIPLVTSVVYSLSLLPSFYTDPAYQRPNYREMVRQITVDPRPGDAIILDAPNQEEVFRYYYKGDAPVYALPPGLGGDDAETAARTQDIVNRHERIFVLFWGEAERDPNHIVENMLDSQTFQAGIDQWYGDVRFAQYVTPADMPDLTVSGARFGDHITLEAYALSAATLQPGDVLQVRLDWQTDAPLDTAYKVFVQLLNSDGGLAAQQDSEPNSGAAPTTTWTPGQTVTDRRGLAIPPDLAPGTYKLIVGLYNRDDASARLSVEGGDYLALGDISITDS